MAAHGLHGLQGFFLAAQGLQGLQAFFFAAQGLHGFFAAHGLHGFFFALQGLQDAITTPSNETALAAGAATIVAADKAVRPTAVTVRDFFNISFSSNKTCRLMTA
ncbi:hypothetical protein [Sneathiella aquimaris]|uniref:hypothetical protein n=1 Tax=Sneathiella aquimaris TaxID=2599305 RepID=UPI001CA513E5|nr:hypothetical protein [Sneathiella aquimaris]